MAIVRPLRHKSINIVLKTDLIHNWVVFDIRQISQQIYNQFEFDKVASYHTNCWTRHELVVIERFRGRVFTGAIVIILIRLVYMVDRAKLENKLYCCFTTILNKLFIEQLNIMNFQQSKHEMII